MKGDTKSCALVTLSVISIISACIAMGGSWYRFPVNPTYAGGCDVTISWDLWRHRCTYVDGACETQESSCMYCKNAEECFQNIPGFIPNKSGGNEHAFKTVEAFVIMQFIFSVFAAGSLCVQGPWALSCHIMTAICGIIAMATFIGLAKSYFPPSENDYLYGYGFAWCVIGWICAVFAAVLTKKVRDDGEKSPQQSASAPEKEKPHVHPEPGPEDFRTQA
eukprot:g2370.t1